MDKFAARVFPYRGSKRVMGEQKTVYSTTQTKGKGVQQKSKEEGRGSGLSVTHGLFVSTCYLFKDEQKCT